MFELSNEDRLDILLELRRSNLNVTGLSQVLDLTTQECSRHLSRLREVGLAKKDIEGFYSVTPYGELVLTQVTDLEFISKHREYFSYHSLAGIPSAFVCRLGELVNSKYTSNIVEIFHRMETMLRQAEKYVWSLLDEYNANTYRWHVQAFQKGLEVRLIEREEWAPPQELRKIVTPEDIRIINRARASGTLKEKVLRHLDVSLLMSEGEVSALCFPTARGRFDYLGFFTEDERAYGWCRDLYEYYWEKAEPRRRFIFK
jgi:predicted transcriptional regulator